MKILRRLLGFTKQDWKHLVWLFGRILNGLWWCDIPQIKSSWFWLKVLLVYDSIERKRELPDV